MELISPPTNASIRLWSLDSWGMAEGGGNPRATEVVAGAMIGWLSQERLPEGDSSYTEPQGTIAILAASVSIPMVANFPGGNYNGIRFSSTTRRWGSGFMLPGGKGLYLTLPPALGVVGDANVWVTVAYDIP